MEDFSYLAPLSMEGYPSLIAKICNFADKNNEFPLNVAELQRLHSLTDDERMVLEHRGKLEKKLNEVKEDKIMLTRTFLKADDNKFVFASSGYILDEYLDKDDYELGFITITNDAERDIKTIA